MQHVIGRRQQLQLSYQLETLDAASCCVLLGAQHAAGAPCFRSKKLQTSQLYRSLSYANSVGVVEAEDDNKNVSQNLKYIECNSGITINCTSEAMVMEK